MVWACERRSVCSCKIGIHGIEHLCCRSGDGRSNERVFVSSIVKDQLSLPPPDAKPEFHNIRACVMKIDPDQTPFFYHADAATGKKVQLPLHNLDMGDYLHSFSHCKKQVFPCLFADPSLPF